MANKDVAGGRASGLSDHGFEKPWSERGQFKTPQEDLRKLAQKLRQAARAELMAIRTARMAQRPQQDSAVAIDDPTPPGAGAGGPRRLRRAKRLAEMHNRLQDARLAVALEAGLIELWTEDGMPNLQLDRVPHLIDHCPQENFDTFAPSRDAVSPDRSAAQPLGEYFGPPLFPIGSAPNLDQLRPTEPSFIGPLWPAVVEVANTEAHDSGVRRSMNGEGPSLGLAWQTAEEDSQLPLTLSSGMRVDRLDHDAIDRRGAGSAVGPAPMPSGTEDPRGLITSAEPDMDADLALGQDRLAAALRQARPGSSDCDLSSLPGAGPGLIWMLQKCGIASLQDLAEADPVTLAPRLGLVGKIVNVQGWQRYAQRQVAQAS